jgi:hypothetical protein
MIEKFESQDKYIDAVIEEYPQLATFLKNKNIYVQMVLKDVAVLIFKYGGCKNKHLEEETRRQLLNLEITGKVSWGKEAWKGEK